MADIFGGIGNMFDSFFHPEQGYEDAEKVFRQFWNEAKARQDPYARHGEEQYGNLMGAEKSLLDPESLLRKWMEGYETSPYAKQSIANARSSGLDAASSQGLLGSSAATNNIQNSANYLMNKDRSEYLNDLMKKYMSGVDLGRDIYGKGAGIAESMGRQGLEFGRDIGGATYGAKNAPGNLLGQLLSMAANGAGNYFTGGSSGAPSSIAA
jgi:hypothetical protein